MSRISMLSGSGSKIGTLHPCLVAIIISSLTALITFLSSVCRVEFRPDEFRTGGPLQSNPHLAALDLEDRDRAGPSDADRFA
jgi:hypothetical protein